MSTQCVWKETQTVMGLRFFFLLPTIKCQIHVRDSHETDSSYCVIAILGILGGAPVALICSRGALRRIVLLFVCAAVWALRGLDRVSVQSSHADWFPFLAFVPSVHSSWQILLSLSIHVALSNQGHAQQSHMAKWGGVNSSLWVKRKTANKSCSWIYLFWFFFSFSFCQVKSNSSSSSSWWTVEAKMKM